MQDKLQVKNRSADDKSEDIKTKDQGKDINKGREEGIHRDVSVAKIERGKIIILSPSCATNDTIISICYMRRKKLEGRVTFENIFVLP